jgi:hypothetical protein
MADIVEPAAFNERFTIYLDHAGKSVQRTLREMSAHAASRPSGYRLQGDATYQSLLT